VRAFQQALDAWRTIRWYRLAWGAASLALAVWLFAIIGHAAATIDSIAGTLPTHLAESGEFREAVVGLAIALSVKASAAIVSGAFGIWEVFNTLSNGRGPRIARVLAVLIPRYLVATRAGAS